MSRSGKRTCSWRKYRDIHPSPAVLRREIKPEYSLKGLMLKLKFQYSGHLMQTGLEKVIPIPKKGNAKECSNYRTIILISHASNVMLKILHFNSMRTENFQMFKLDLEKAGEPEIKLPTSVGL